MGEVVNNFCMELFLHFFLWVKSALVHRVIVMGHSGGCCPAQQRVEILGCRFPLDSVTF